MKSQKVKILFFSPSKIGTDPPLSVTEQHRSPRDSPHCRTQCKSPHTLRGIVSFLFYPTPPLCPAMSMSFLPFSLFSPLFLRPDSSPLPLPHFSHEFLLFVCRGNASLTGCYLYSYTHPHEPHTHTRTHTCTPITQSAWVLFYAIYSANDISVICMYVC